METTETHDGVLLRRRDGVAWIVLNEPERRNPMSPTILTGVSAACERIEADPEIRAVVLTGSGPAFCAGGDLTHNDRGFEGDEEEVRAFLWSLYRPILRVLELPMPTIAAVNGVAVGGGLAMTLLCDVRVASEVARFVPGFSGLGFVAGMGLTYTLAQHVGRGRASEILYADRSLDAAEALEIGLVQRVVAAEEFDRAVADLAVGIAEKGAEANRAMKALISGSYREGLHHQLEREIESQLRSVRSEEYQQRREAISGRVPRAT